MHMDRINVCGIICEYNPFHKGHMYQIAEARKRTKASYIIAVMSGNFVQRGEPAILNKWARTQMALQGGADLVVELPLPYALASAEFFSFGAICTLKNMGIVTHVSFGSESFDSEVSKEKIIEAAAREIIIDKDLLKKGASYAAAARSEANILPNDLLGVSYVRAANKLDFPVTFVPVKRLGGGHDNQGSAKFIRENFIFPYGKTDRQGEDRSLDELFKYVPDFVINIIKNEITCGRGPVCTHEIEKIILADLRRKKPEEIAKAPFVSEGIEYKIFSEALNCTSFDELVKKCTSKRYTSSRIRRVVFASILNIKKEMIYYTAPYIRVLGMKRSAGELMKLIKESSNVPVILSKAEFLKNAKKNKNVNLSLAEDFLNIENNAAEIYSLGYILEKERLGASELTHPLVFL